MDFSLAFLWLSFVLCKVEVSLVLWSCVMRMQGVDMHKVLDQCQWHNSLCLLLLPFVASPERISWLYNVSLEWEISQAPLGSSLLFYKRNWVTGSGDMAGWWHLVTSLSSGDAKGHQLSHCFLSISRTIIWWSAFSYFMCLSWGLLYKLCFHSSC